MAKQQTRYIGAPAQQKTVSKLDTLHDTWRVMKPFVHFSVKALKVIAYSLIFIVKHIPKLEQNKANRAKGNKMIKIN